MSRILIAEDEARISSFIEKGLRANGLTRPSWRAGSRPSPWLEAVNST